jgi:hypothetical protein
MKSKAPKSWSRKKYTQCEMRRAELLFSQNSQATEDERQAYIREQTAEVQRAWRRYDMQHRTVQQSPEVEVPVWKVS